MNKPKYPLTWENAQWWADAIPVLFGNGSIPYISLHMCQGRQSSPTIRTNQRLCPEDMRGCKAVIPYTFDNEQTGVLHVGDTYGLWTINADIWIETFRDDYSIRWHTVNGHGEEIQCAFAVQGDLTREQAELWRIAKAKYLYRDRPLMSEVAKELAARDVSVYIGKPLSAVEVTPV